MVDKYISCAWDVGIKTLSYCAIEFDKNDATYWKVLNLGQINLLTTNNYKCQGKSAKNIACSTKAIYCGKNINNEEYYYCGKHKAQYKSFFQPETYFKKKQPNEILHCDCLLSNNKQCNKNAGYITKNNNLCTMHMNAQKKKLTKLTNIHKLKKITCASENLEQFAISMYTKLHDKPELFNVDNIKIENQPSLLNPIMKSLSMLLFSYSISRKLLPDSKIQNVKFVAPSSKLNISFDIMKIIIDQSRETDKVIVLLYKLLLQIEPNYPSSSYKGYFGDKCNLFLALIALRVVNKKYEVKDDILEDLSNATFDKNKISKIIDSLHDKNNNKKSNKKNNNKNNNKDDNNNNDNIKEEIKEDIKTTDKEHKHVYNITKALSIKYTLILLINKGQDDFVKLIQSYNKCDDLTDAFLLCFNTV